MFNENPENRYTDSRQKTNNIFNSFCEFVIYKNTAGNLNSIMIHRNLKMNGNLCKKRVDICNLRMHCSLNETMK